MSQTYLQTWHSSIKKQHPRNSSFSKHKAIRTAKKNKQTISLEKFHAMKSIIS